MTDPIQGMPRIDWESIRLEIAPPETAGSEFADALKDTLGQVEDLQASASQHVNEVLHGNGQDLHSALIAVEKADLSFQLMMQVRNKIVQAYQEVSRMAF